MHLVFLNQYYPPDAAPTGMMLQAVADQLVKSGHLVTVICGPGGYAGAKTVKKVISDQLAVISGKGGDGGDGGRSALGCCQSIASRQQPTANGKQLRANSQLPTSVRQATIIRIGATRFGRGTFVGKLLDYFSYYLVASWKLASLKDRPDRIVALTTPPYLSVVARLLSKFRSADHAHWVMDLYPDVMVAHGMLGEGSLKHRVLRAMAKWGFGGKRCAAVLTLGPDMAERVAVLMQQNGNDGNDGNQSDANGHDLNGISECGSGAQRASALDFGQPRPTFSAKVQSDSSVKLRSRTPKNAEHSLKSAPFHSDDSKSSEASPIQWIPLWGTSELLHAPASDGRELRSQRSWSEDDLIVMYSGNMGLGHRFQEFLSAAKELAIAKERQIRFAFFGEGKRRGEIEVFIEKNPDCAVELHGYAPGDILDAHLRSADVHLVSLEASWTGTMVPSKLQGIFAVGRPVIFVGPAESSIGQWVEESGGGWVVEPNDLNAVVSAIREAADQRIRKDKGQAALGFARSHFDRTKNAGEVATFLSQGSRR